MSSFLVGFYLWESLDKGMSLRNLCFCFLLVPHGFFQPRLTFCVNFSVWEFLKHASKVNLIQPEGGRTCSYGYLEDTGYFIFRCFFLCISLYSHPFNPEPKASQTNFLELLLSQQDDFFFSVLPFHPGCSFRRISVLYMEILAIILCLSQLQGLYGS